VCPVARRAGRSGEVSIRLPGLFLQGSRRTESGKSLFVFRVVLEVWDEALCTAIQFPEGRCR